MSWKYKVKPSFHRAGMKKDWQDCSQEQMENLKRMRPNAFLFEEIKPPEPTPNMITEAARKTAEDIAKTEVLANQEEGEEAKQEEAKPPKKKKSKK